MSGKICTRIKYQLTIEEELFEAADKKIAELNKLGVAQGRTDLSEPEQQHIPLLVSLGKFENWAKNAKSYVIDKRLKRQGRRSLNRHGSEESDQEQEEEYEQESDGTEEESDGTEEESDGTEEESDGTEEESDGEDEVWQSAGYYGDAEVKNIKYEERVEGSQEWWGWEQSDEEEGGFYEHEQVEPDEDKNILDEDIFKPVEVYNGRTKKCSSVMVLAPAGMGKTTLLRRIAQKTRRGEYKELEDKLVLVPDFRPHLQRKEILPSQALLGNMFSDWGSERMKQRYQWIIDNAEKVVFIIDSLDTLPFGLENEGRPRPRNCPNHEAATAEDVLRDILARDWFPESIIISSSREYKVRNLHPSFRPDRCILLDGLTDESVENLVDGFLGKAKGAEVKSHIKTECPDIWPLLSIPVFMVFTVIGLSRDGFKPKTMSGILIKFFQSLIRSSHIHVSNILAVFNKLMPLAFEGTRNQFVLFTPKCLKRFGLEPEEVTDLGILVPQSQGTFLSTKLMQNDLFFLYFNHQTEQEALAALHVLSMRVVEFENFVECEIWAMQFTVVRRLICGTLLNDEVLEGAQELTEILDVDEKKIILIRSLRIALEKSQQKYNMDKLLELFIDLSECREGVTELIRSSVKKINFYDFSLSPVDVQAVAFVIKQCEHIEVNLQYCNLNDEKMKILTRTIMQSNVKLDFCVSGNEELGSEGANHLGKLVKNNEVKILDAGGSIRGCESVEKFTEGLGDAKIDYLYLTAVYECYTRSLLDLLPHVDKILDIHEWKITKSQRQELQQRLNEIGSPSLEVVIPEEGNDVIYLKASLMDSTSDSSVYQTTTRPQHKASTSGIIFSSGILPVPKKSENETKSESATAMKTNVGHRAVQAAAKISAEIERRIKTESTQSKIVCTEGGFVKNFGSKAIFSRGAFNKDTEVQTSVITDFSDCPEDKVPIAPSIKCSPSGKLNKPALLEIDHWAFPNRRDFYVDVYRRDNEDSERRFFKKVLVKANQKISFYTDHFSIFEFLVECLLWIRGIVAIQIHVYISGPKESITCVCCLKNEKVNNDVIQTLKENGFVSLLSLPKTTHIKRDGQVKITIKCTQPSNLRIISDDDDEGNVPTAKEIENVFLADEILKKCSDNFDLQLGLQGSHLTTHKGMLRFRYSHIAENDKAKHPMPISWPITVTQAINAQSRSTANVTGQFVNIGGQLMTEQYGGSNKVTSDSQMENEQSVQSVRQQGYATSNVTAGTYNAGRMTSNQFDTTTQVFSK